jgi:hypothetical protein
MKKLVPRIIFLVVVWLLGWWQLGILKKNYSCYTVFPEAKDLVSCQRLAKEMHILITPELLEKIIEANSGVLFLNLSYFVFMISLSIVILYLGFRKNISQ